MVYKVEEEGINTEISTNIPKNKMSGTSNQLRFRGLGLIIQLGLHWYDRFWTSLTLIQFSLISSWIYTS